MKPNETIYLVITKWTDKTGSYQFPRAFKSKELAEQWIAERVDSELDITYSRDYNKSHEIQPMMFYKGA